MKSIQTLNGFTDEFYQTFNEEIIYKLSQKIEKEGIFHNLFCEASITLKLKPDKDIAEKTTTNILHRQRCKNSNQNLPN